MSGKVILRMVKIVCLFSLLFTIFFYQGQAGSGCPPGGGGSTPPGCNPPGATPGGSGDGTTNCSQLTKKDDCNNRQDCAWYVP
ncbi:MAG: hypothetical protein ACK4NF_05440, partial [Planctomycetota bacterium]